MPVPRASSAILMRHRWLGHPWGSWSTASRDLALARAQDSTGKSLRSAAQILIEVLTCLTLFEHVNPWLSWVLLDFDRFHQF